jgi:hypothetical protein
MPPTSGDLILTTKMPPTSSDLVLTTKMPPTSGNINIHRFYFLVVTSGF